MSDVPIRDAASVILLRDAKTNPRVLMGQRGKTAVFMPNKYVFPGGAVDPGDAQIKLAELADADSMTRLGLRAPKKIETALLAAAIREVWEETGLIFAQPGDGPDCSNGNWPGFAQAGLRPSAAGFRYVFRAITPPNRPRRFDARFFLVDAHTAVGDLDDFANAEDELQHLHWVGLKEARNLNLPFITEVVLAEVAALARSSKMPGPVPFFNNSDDVSEFLRLG